MEAVNRHPHVLQDSLSLIRLLETVPTSPEQEILLTSADVAALYPSIDIEDGMKALKLVYHMYCSLNTLAWQDLFQKTVMSNAKVSKKRLFKTSALLWKPPSR